MVAFVAALWGEPVAAAINDTAPYAAVRRVLLSWSERVRDMVVHSVESVVSCRLGAAAPSFHPDPRSTSTVI
ncbi:hypothetical protein GCM10010412_076770 [Nonomuraea recticatena]|uniref:Uncharacterized protein n=1 Tax=Nonomuraea recticatena TaxID=46178 RepID=A0ABN3SXV9_9ACTN